MSWKLTLVPPPKPNAAPPAPAVKRRLPEPRRVVWLSRRLPDEGEMKVVRLAFGAGAWGDPHCLDRPVAKSLIYQLTRLAREEKDFHDLPIVCPCQEKFMDEMVERVSHALCGEGLHCYFLVKRNDLPIALYLFDGRQPSFFDRWLAPQMVDLEENPKQRPGAKKRQVIKFTRFHWALEHTYPGEMLGEPA